MPVRQRTSPTHCLLFNGITSPNAFCKQEMYGGKYIAKTTCCLLCSWPWVFR